VESLRSVLHRQCALYSPHTSPSRSLHAAADSAEVELDGDGECSVSQLDRDLCVALEHYAEILQAM